MKKTKPTVYGYWIFLAVVLIVQLLGGILGNTLMLALPFAVLAIVLIIMNFVEGRRALEHFRRADSSSVSREASEPSEQGSGALAAQERVRNYRQFMTAACVSSTTMIVFVLFVRALMSLT